MIHKRIMSVFVFRTDALHCLAMVEHLGSHTSLAPSVPAMGCHVDVAAGA